MRSKFGDYRYDYSDEYGGYVRTLSPHLNMFLTEERRVGWVQLRVKAAHEVGLSIDPECGPCFKQRSAA